MTQKQKQQYFVLWIALVMAAVVAPLILIGQDSNPPEPAGAEVVNALEAWPLEFTAAKATGKITIDGTLDEPAWKRSMIASGFAFPWHNHPPQNQTRVRMLWDDKNLYVAFEARDGDIEATCVANQGRLWEDGRVMLYIDFAPDDEKYYGLEINPAGFYLSYQADLSQEGAAERFDTRRWDATKIEGFAVKTAIDGTLNNADDTDRSYTVELSIPWESMPDHGAFAAKAGGRFRVGLLRIDRLPKKPAHEWPHSMWSADWDESPNFHYPKSFVSAVLK